MERLSISNVIGMVVNNRFINVDAVTTMKSKNELHRPRDAVANNDWWIAFMHCDLADESQTNFQAAYKGPVCLSKPTCK